MKRVAVLFARPNSVYWQFPDADVYDLERDALTYPGGLPVVAHPPCAPWSRLRAFCKSGPQVKALAPWAVWQVRRCGGVLEHPAQSSLWPYLGLPKPGSSDRFGFSWGLDQHWFGHPGRKRTWLYICGTTPDTLPPMEFKLAARLPDIAVMSHAARDGTPPRFAEWLIQVALVTRNGDKTVSAMCVYYSTRSQHV